jgi:hypothetical protein
MEHVMYNESGQPLGVPYHRDCDDPNSHSYVDLKREPNRIDEIPELRDEPALQRLVVTLNDPRGCFRSIGCERWYTPQQVEGERGQFGSYVGFALDAWPFREKEAAQSIAADFIDREAPLPEDFRMIIELRPTAFHHEKLVGWSLEFWGCGLGADRESAHAAWEAGIARFVQFIEAESMMWRGIIAVMPDPQSPSASRFQVIRQQDAGAGCIPACAISVLRHAQRAAPEESDLIGRMWRHQSEGSGFARLRSALGSEVIVRVEEPRQLGARLAELTNGGRLVLVAVKGHQHGAHCLIVERVANGWVRYHDPAHGIAQAASIEDLEALAAGDIAYLETESATTAPST